MNELRLVVFDVGGTTVHDSGQVLGALTEALATHGVAITPEQLSAVRGSSKRHAVWHITPEGSHRDQRAQEIYESFRECLKERYSAEPVVAIDGAEVMFDWLRSNGVQVALNTGFDRDTTDLLLSELHWGRDRVDAVICADDVARGRPDPYLIFHAMEATGTNSVHAVGCVGDTVLDLEAGYRAGVRWNVGVLTGAHDRERLERAPHTHLLPSVAALRELWSDVFRRAARSL